jgi:hypothetical protein
MDGILQAAGTGQHPCPRGLQQHKHRGALVVSSLLGEIKMSDYLRLILGRNKEVNFSGQDLFGDMKQDIWMEGIV